MKSSNDHPFKGSVEVDKFFIGGTEEGNKAGEMKKSTSGAGHSGRWLRYLPFFTHSCIIYQAMKYIRPHLS